MDMDRVFIHRVLSVAEALRSVNCTAASRQVALQLPSKWTARLDAEPGVFGGLRAYPREPGPCMKRSSICGRYLAPDLWGPQMNYELAQRSLVLVLRALVFVVDI